MEKLIKNFKTAIKVSGASQKDWCIAPMPATPIKQIKVAISGGKSYDYACRYDAKEDAVTIIGCGLPVDLYTHSLPSVNTGSMGVVETVSPKLTINRRHAVEVDCVFNIDPTKADLTKCVKYLKLDSASYEKTLRFDKRVYPIRPITYHTRRILAAASVLAHPSLVTKQDQKLAEDVILQNPQIDADMLLDTPGIALYDVHTPDANITDSFKKIAEELGNHQDWDAENGELACWSKIIQTVAGLSSVNDYVSKYAHVAAVSIMVRGGFMNLLTAYLSVNPLIDGYYDEMCELLSGIGNKETFEILKQYHK